MVVHRFVFLGSTHLYKHFLTHHGVRGVIRANVINIGGQNIQKVAQFDNSKGKTYREILDLAKQGKTPISIAFYNKNRNAIVNELLAYLPATSDLHGSFAPQGATFKEANSKYGSRYEGYHVSEDSQTGEKILFPMAKKLPDAKGNEITVADAKDSIVLVKLDIVNGKPTIEYDHDAKKNETLVSLNTSDLTCVAFPTKDGWYKLQNGIFVKSNSSDSNANYLHRADDANWNGFFVYGVVGEVDGGGLRGVLADDWLSHRFGVLAKETGAIAQRLLRLLK